MMDWSLMASRSMRVNDLDVEWAPLAIGPLETDAPLIVDSDAVLSRSIALQGFKAIAWWGHQVTKRHRRLDTIKLAKRLSGEPRESWDMPPVGKPLGSLVPVLRRHVPSSQPPSEL
jgi:hypothetical protein